MTLHSALEKVLSSEMFRSWISLHSKAFLAHAFLMSENAWQFGWYNPDNNKITTFIVEKDISKIENQEIFSTGEPVKPLPVDKVKVTETIAIQKAKEVLEKNYNNEQVLKIFLLLQLLGELPIYTITFFTKSLNAITVKISAIDGKTASHTKSSFTDFSRVTTQQL
ncbi:hypothetical protein HYV79_00020 [Candidatus Woesearchaeota archaeon]|nr:hypothetical protein [Candidatus Woesearchaeota archaeon]